MKKIAVILPVYKNDKVAYIKLSFDSILNQTYNDTDLFIGVDARLFHLTWKRDGKAPYPICGEWGIFSLFCMSVS